MEKFLRHYATWNGDTCLQYSATFTNAATRKVACGWSKQICRILRKLDNRADQTTKIRGMLVRPEQIAEIGERHPALGRRAWSLRARARQMR